MTVMDNTAARTGNAWVNTLIVLVCVALTAAVLGVVFRGLAANYPQIRDWIDSQVYFWSDPTGYRNGKYKLSPITPTALWFNQTLLFAERLGMYDWPLIGLSAAVILRFFFPMSRRIAWRRTLEGYWLGLGAVSMCLTAPVAAVMFVVGGAVAVFMSPVMLLAFIGWNAPLATPDPEFMRSVFWGPLTMLDAVLIMIIPAGILLSALAWVAWSWKD